MRILLASHTAPGGVFTVGSHHLLRELSAQGHQVCHLSSPISLAHLSRLRDVEVRRRYRLALHPARDTGTGGHYLPLTLLPMSVGAWLTSGPGLRTAVPAIRSTLRRLGFSRVDALVVDQPLLAGIERHVDAGVMVYRSTDVVETSAKSAGERQVLARADGIVATSAAVRDGLVALRPHVPALLLENGVEFDHFAGAGQSARDGVVYVGAIDDRFDWDVVAAMARGNPDVALRIYGPVDVPPAQVPPNVSVRGPVSYDEAATLLRGARVGILPFKRTAMNDGRSPMKFYEYLAAGLNVVTTLPLSPSQRVCPGVWSVADDRGEGDSLRAACAAPVNDAGVEAARAMDWAGRARELVGFLERLQAGRSRP